MESVIQMYGTASADSDSVAQIDVPEDAHLHFALLNIRSPSGMTSAKYAQMEVSFLSSSQFSTNDARGIIGRCQISGGTVTTSGQVSADGQAHLHFPKGISVVAGERIHLHIETSDTVLITCHALLVFKFKGGIRQGRRR